MQFELTHYRKGGHMDIPTLRKLVALDENDPLSRFALGRKLFETDASAAALTEAAEHLQFANAHSPDHVATYHILGQVLGKLGKKAQARLVYEEGLRRTAEIGEGMGRDLAPAMQRLLGELH